MAPHSADFYLAFSRALGKVIAHIHGALNTDTAPELHDRLVDIIDGQGNRQVVVDLSSMTGIDSAGFSDLLDASRRIRKTGGELMLSGPTEEVVRAFEVARLHKIFVITPAWSHPVHGRAREVVGRPRSGGHAR